MINVITALCNPILNDRLKIEKDINVLANDIQYQDGIFETIYSNDQIDYLIISEFIPGMYEIKELFNKIKKENDNIKIIIILEKQKEELENYLYSKGIYKIFYNNKIEINEIIDIIKEDNTNMSKNDRIIKEIEDLKNILVKNNIDIYTGANLLSNNKDNSNNSGKNIKTIFNRIYKRFFNSNIQKNKEKFDKKVISILGTGGVGKSISTINISNLLKDNNYKVLIIDFDILNNSLHTFLNVDKYPDKIKEKVKNNDLINKKIKVKELIIKIDNNIDLISGINLLFDSKYKISSSKIKNILTELKDYYDYIVIDNSAECFLDYTKNIIQNSDLNIYILESNVLEIKKAKRWLEIYYNEWKIEKERISLLINKYNKYSISDKSIKDIFYDYKILGKISFNKKYNKLINRENKRSLILKKEINREYKKALDL